MIRALFRLFAGSIIAACVACMPVPPAPMASGAQPVVGSAAAQSCLGTFLSNVRVLSDSFAPQAGAIPPIGTPLSQNPSFTAGLTGAFNAASPAFQQLLCSLNAVYISPICQSGTGCTDFSNSWGWRRRVGARGVRESYIAISAGLWNEPNYSHYETDLLRSTLAQNSASPLNTIAYSNAKSCSPVGSANCLSVDTLAMTLLAAIAHEVGHVRWYVLVDPNFPDGNSLALRCQGGGDFFGGSWKGAPHHPPGSGAEWRAFSMWSERITNPDHWPDRHTLPPDIADIDQTSGDLSLVVKLLAPDHPWPTALAASAPDEDFVETYKFKVLTTANPPLNSMILTIPANPQKTYNIPLDYFTSGARPELTRKVNCIPDTF
jgi:hypothetical protein